MPKKKGRAGGRKRGSDEARAAKIAAKRERKAGQYLGRGDPDYKSLSAQLRVQGLALKDVPGDGNCLFRALAEQLHDRHGNLRRRAVDYMRLNADEFTPFLSEEQSLESYLAELSQDGVYAGNDAIVALSRTCKVNVVIHQLRTPRWEIRCSGLETATLHIAYLRGEHYCSVGPVHPGHSLPQLEEVAGAACGGIGIEPGPPAKPMVSDWDNRCVEQVLDATGCKDRGLAEECLRDNNGEVDLAIVEALQLLALSDTSSGGGGGLHSKQVGGGEHHHQVNPRKETASSPHTGKPHLSNKERKKAARVAKNPGKVMQKFDQDADDPPGDPVGSLPI